MRIRLDMKKQLTLAMRFLLLITLAGGVRAADAAGEKTPARPNILFCIADDASMTMGAYGYKWVHTPAFDRVASEGLLFTNAWTPNAKCAPSRACILTGRNSWQLEAAANHMCYFPAKFKTYVETLTQHGYFTGYTGKPWAPGVAVDDHGKPREMAGHEYDTRKLKPPTSGISKVDYAGNFNDFLDACPKGEPFCFWYGSHEPHRGYELGSGLKSGKKLSDVDRIPPYLPDNATVRSDLLDYAVEVEWFDTELAKILAELDRRGLADNTIVVVTSDNGMPFPRIKGQEYAASNHLPLAIRWPAGIANPGRKIDDFVSFIDFAPTFLQLAKVSPAESGMKPITGRSLVGIFRSTKSGVVEADRDHVLIGKERHDVGRPHDWGYPIRGIVKGGVLYLENFEPTRWPAGNPETGYPNCDSGPTKKLIVAGLHDPTTYKFWQWSFGLRPPEEVFDISHDPACMTNLVGNPEYDATRRSLRTQMESELKQQQDPRMFGEGHVFDDYPYAGPKFRNLYDRVIAGEKLKIKW